MKYVFHPEALTEFSEAALYYSKKNSNLGLAFYAEVENAIYQLIENPTLFQVIEEDVSDCGSFLAQSNLIRWAVSHAQISLWSTLHYRRRSRIDCRSNALQQKTILLET